MVVLFVLLTLFVMLLIDFLVIWPIQQSKKAKTKPKQEIFYTPEVGFTMCDGGEPYKEKEKTN